MMWTSLVARSPDRSVLPFFLMGMCIAALVIHHCNPNKTRAAALAARSLGRSFPAYLLLVSCGTEVLYQYCAMQQDNIGSCAS